MGVQVGFLISTADSRNHARRRRCRYRNRLDVREGAFAADWAVEPPNRRLATDGPLLDERVPFPAAVPNIIGILSHTASCRQIGRRASGSISGINAECGSRCGWPVATAWGRFKRSPKTTLTILIEHGVATKATRNPHGMRERRPPHAPGHARQIRFR